MPTPRGFRGLGETIMVLEGLGHELSLGDPTSFRGLGATGAEIEAMHKAIVDFAKNPKIGISVDSSLSGGIVSNGTLNAIAATFGAAQRYVPKIPSLVRNIITIITALTPLAPESAKQSARSAVASAANAIRAVYTTANAAVTAFARSGSTGGGTGALGTGIPWTYVAIGGAALFAVLLLR